MTNGLIAFMLGAGLATWVYSKMYSRTGGNSQNAAVVAGVAGVAGFVLMLLILNAIPS